MTGIEWLVEAYGCEPRHLSDLSRFQRLFTQIINEMGLHPVQPAQWHQFPGAAGVTGMVVLAESHLACHSFPEHGSLCLNLFCCKPRPDWPFSTRLTELFAASEVNVRRFERDYAASRAGKGAA